MTKAEEYAEMELYEKVNTRNEKRIVLIRETAQQFIV